MKNILIRIDEETHKKLKMYAVENEISFQKLVLDYLKSLIEEK